METYKVLDLFAGAGGFSQGFGSCPNFRIACANEIDPEIAITYRVNHPRTRLVVGDITEPEVKDSIGKSFLRRPCHVVLGGVPCPFWSRSGRRAGFGDPRGKLWFDYSEMVSRLRPLVFVAENVAARG